MAVQIDSKCALESVARRLTVLGHQLAQSPCVDNRALARDGTASAASSAWSHIEQVDAA